jgi:hypothetical protein
LSVIPALGRLRQEDHEIRPPELYNETLSQNIDNNNEKNNVWTHYSKDELILPKYSESTRLVFTLV